MGLCAFDADWDAGGVGGMHLVRDGAVCVDAALSFDLDYGAFA